MAPSTLPTHHPPPTTLRPTTQSPVHPPTTRTSTPWTSTTATRPGPNPAASPSSAAPLVLLGAAFVVAVAVVFVCVLRACGVTPKVGFVAAATAAAIAARTGIHVTERAAHRRRRRRSPRYEQWSGAGHRQQSQSRRTPDAASSGDDDIPLVSFTASSSGGVGRGRRGHGDPRASGDPSAGVERLMASTPTARTPTSILRKHLNLLKPLGRGAFGVVYRASLVTQAAGSPPPPAVVGWSPPAGTTTTITVAAKVCSQLDRGGVVDLTREATMMAGLNHPNIVRLIGMCSQGAQPIIVTELCQCDVASFLKSQSHPHTDPAHICLLAGRDVSAGMAFMAALGCIHRDLAARNVLMTSPTTGLATGSESGSLADVWADGRVGNDVLVFKVSDFGLSRSLLPRAEHYSGSEANALPIRWLAPECFGTNRYTVASDVWAFGIFMFEIFTKADIPYRGLTAVQVILEVQQGHRLSCPPGCSDVTFHTMRSCWSARPAARPPFPALYDFFASSLGQSGTQQAVAVTTAEPEATAARLGATAGPAPFEAANPVPNPYPLLGWRRSPHPLLVRPYARTHRTGSLSSSRELLPPAEAGSRAGPELGQGGAYTYDDDLETFAATHEGLNVAFDPIGGNVGDCGSPGVDGAGDLGS